MFQGVPGSFGGLIDFHMSSIEFQRRYRALERFQRISMSIKGILEGFRV